MTAIDTPCIKVCAIDPVSRLCAGCGRSLSEIGRWGSMSGDERRRIMAELPGRRPEAPPAVVATARFG